MRAWFTSLDGGDQLRQRVLDVLTSAADRSAASRVDVHIMTFSFTDPAIADLLARLVARSPNLRVRVIADWSQGAPSDQRQVARLAASAGDRLLVRYKLDQPYVWDAEHGRLRWSYRASRGLLHHKTLATFVDGEPLELVCGSFNWTGRAAASYENLLVLGHDEPGGAEVMRAVELEFEALWSDGRLTVTPAEAVAHHRAILEQYRTDPLVPPELVTGLGAGRDDPLSIMSPTEPARDGTGARPLTVAFSSRGAHEPSGGRGYAPANANRSLLLHKPGGSRTRAPLDLTTAALDVLAAARGGDELHVAMYGLSRRVPEYNALLSAARRGVSLHVLLDGRIGASVLRHLARTAAKEGLPVQVRAGRRTMHQKYVVHRASSTVLVGTANLSTDASRRHSEHLLVARGDDALVDRFLADFGTIWERLPGPGTTARAR